MIGEFRRSRVLVPVDGGGVLAADFGGVCWLYAFSDEESLSRFATARGNAAGTEVSYMSMYGARLLDVAVPAVGVPAGVAVDVAGPSPLLLPPMGGVVPDAVAVA
jgi:SseB protein N-terminal domain